MYQIKTEPEHFIVEEQLTLPITEKGHYAYYSLWKRDVDHFRALNRVSEKLHVPLKHINVAGTKDKRAVTLQYFSVLHGKQNSFEESDLKVTFLGYGNDRLQLGSLQGNRFTLRVLTDQKPRTLPQDAVVNYFDDQRFGISAANQIVGKHLIKKEFVQACTELRKSHASVDRYITEHPSDCIGALRTLPRKLLTMFVAAYQSYLFNQLCKDTVRARGPYYDVPYALGMFSFPLGPLVKQEIPLVGFGTENYDELFRNEQIEPRDFLMKQMPEVSSAGDVRSLLIPVHPLFEKIEEGYIVSFVLPKGSYATVVIKALFG